MLTLKTLSISADLSETSLREAFDLLPAALWHAAELRVASTELFAATRLVKGLAGNTDLFARACKYISIFPDHLRESQTWELRVGDTIVYSGDI